MSRRVVFVLYPGFELLDLSGPAAVFGDANMFAEGAYRLAFVSASGGPVASCEGAAVVTERLDEVAGLDTLVIVGGSAEAVRTPPEETLVLIERLSASARRTASVCTGAFLLARLGALDGRRATTHWKYAAELQALAPRARVDADRIFVNDGAVWTSAGVTAGIDLALAMVEEDLGREASREVARGLVVYQRRLGGQRQYSALLELEPPSDRVRRALAFARDHLAEPLPVARLAEAASLSERQFARSFTAETGMSPAKAVERLRAEAARPLVEDSAQPFEVIARAVGFSDPERMRQAFVRAFGQPPQGMRRRERAHRRAG